MSRLPAIARLICAVVACLAATGAYAESSERTGYAYDKQTGEFLYSETHREIKSDGRVVRNTVEYKDTAGKVFAQKRIDFKRSATMPDFHLINARSGHVEAARGAGNRLTLRFQRLSDSDVKEATLELPPNGVIDAGFDRFIEQHWDSLVGGAVIDREFLIPSQLDFYTFEIERTDSKRVDEIAFELRVKSIFLQMFVSPVLVHYDARTRALLRYEGISNIRDENGENFDVRIEFPEPNQVQVEAGVAAPSS